VKSPIVILVDIAKHAVAPSSCCPAAHVRTLAVHDTGVSQAVVAVQWRCGVWYWYL